MAQMMHDAMEELADNWPAFLYIFTMVGFSLRFLHERREETKTLRRIADELQHSYHERCDRLEALIRSEASARFGVVDRANASTPPKARKELIASSNHADIR